jgi:hypothetical protein
MNQAFIMAGTTDGAVYLWDRSSNGKLRFQADSYVYNVSISDSRILAAVFISGPLTGVGDRLVLPYLIWNQRMLFCKLALIPLGEILKAFRSWLENKAMDSSRKGILGGRQADSILAWFPKCKKAAMALVPRCLPG